MTKKGYTYTKIVDFLTLRERLVVLGCGNICDIVKILNFFFSPWYKGRLTGLRRARTLMLPNALVF